MVAADSYLEMCFPRQSRVVLGSRKASKFAWQVITGLRQLFLSQFHTEEHRCRVKNHKMKKKIGKKKKGWDFSGGAMVKNPPANAGDTVSSPGPGRSHMPQSS